MAGAKKGDWAAAVIALRAHLGITQEELAQTIGVTVSTVNRWENAHASPIRVIRRLVREFGAQRGFTGFGEES